MTGQTGRRRYDLTRYKYSYTFNVCRITYYYYLGKIWGEYRPKLYQYEQKLTTKKILRNGNQIIFIDTITGTPVSSASFFTKHLARLLKIPSRGLLILKNLKSFLFLKIRYKQYENWMIFALNWNHLSILIVGNMCKK